MRVQIATAAVTWAGASVVVLTAFWQPSPLLVWNASASVPIGIYAVRPAGPLAITELVVARPPEPLATFLADGGYLPDGLPLIKRIAGLSGQTVCRHGAAISVDGTVWAHARERDHAGRLLPVWIGCRRLGPDEVFLLNWREPASLDGRYFGPLQRTSILGRAAPLLTTKER